MVHGEINMEQQAEQNKPQGSYAKGFGTTPKQMEYQKAMIEEDHEFQYKMQEAQHKQEQTMKNKDLGWIGFIFGTAENASKNIAALISLILIIGAIIFSCIIYCCGSDNTFIETIWDIVLPVVTLSLGYIFGKKD